MEGIGIGGSSTARAFGATINLKTSDQGLFLVTGYGPSLIPLVKSAGGEVVLRLSDTRVLASMRFKTYLAFRQNPEIAFIGPVSIDRERFARFMALLAQSRASSNGGST